MRKLLRHPLFLIAGFIGLLTLPNVIKKAHAGDIFVVQLVSSDGGATQTAALQQFQTYDIWCQIPSVFKTDVMTAGVVGDGGIFMTVDVPAQVFQLPASTAALSYGNWNGAGLEGSAQSGIPRGTFYSGLHTGIVALANDGGNPACNVELRYNGQ